MPATIEAVGAPTGLTLTASIYPNGLDVAADTGLTCTEASNRKGLYTFENVNNRTGLHLIHLKSGANVIWYGWAVLETSGTITAVDDRATAQLQFTTARQVDANVRCVNSVQVGGTGASGDEWGPA